MAGRIRQEDVAAVRERTDIAQVVSGYLQLRKAGRDSFVGLCPFHTEKTASFSVSPSKQLYYCFGCGEGGDVLRFLEKMENLSFVEAVEKLAGNAGITLRYEGETAAGRKGVGRRQVLHRAVQDAARLYHRMLLEGREGAEARAYLESRNISKESADRFDIGYAPGYQDFLLKRLSKTYSPELLVEAGLVARNSGGALRDRFRARVMFPIHDLSGNPVGFGGRLLAGDRGRLTEATSSGRASSPDAGRYGPQAKYVNSPESPVYHKGTLLYNLNRAKSEITREGRAVLVEGYTDVIALDQAGVSGVVATCGTALGEEHIRLLSRFTERVVLAFDSDEAGARAAERAYQFHQSYQVDISVLVLPSGEDPADFVLAGGDQAAGPAFLELAGRSVPLVEYMIGRSLIGRDLSDSEARARAVRDALPIVAGLEEEVRRHEYARLLAGKVGEPEIKVMLQLERMTGERPSSGQPDRDNRARIPPEDEVEREVLKLMVQAPGLCADRLTETTADLFAKPTHRKAFEFILAWRGSSGVHHAWPGTPGPGAEDGTASLVALAHERGDHLGRIMSALAFEPLKSQGDPTHYAEKLFLSLEEFSMKRQADGIRKQLERMNPIKAPGDYEALFGQLVALEGARRRIRAAAEAVGTAT